jgi:hypothetical protein
MIRNIPHFDRLQPYLQGAKDAGASAAWVPVYWVDLKAKVRAKTTQLRASKKGVVQCEPLYASMIRQYTWTLHR